ncbi:hypothetical protein I79_014653 [Cricetulus griseus]|uniref:Uncharacterized protein n=1 Tax=Cricetulus griseus TaxID=10029 RepID=G3HUP0_CRIGR|nr:hypothetical protein I79_014653 [Cricetulus griseus]
MEKIFIQMKFSGLYRREAANVLNDCSTLLVGSAHNFPFSLHPLYGKRKLTLFTEFLSIQISS